MGTQYLRGSGWTGVSSEVADEVDLRGGGWTGVAPAVDHHHHHHHQHHQHHRVFIRSFVLKLRPAFCRVSNPRGSGRFL